MNHRWLALAAFPLLAAAQDLKEFEKKVTEFDLDNGMHWIVLQKPEAPVVSFVMHVDVGAANDATGQTGMAHMFEHMAFKGTDSLGTKNWTEEKKALDEVERVYDQLDAEKNKGPHADKANVERLEAALKKAIEKANSYVEKEAYSKLIQRNGGVGLNAGTSVDATFYHYSLPANRVELWFLLTSQVFRNPILREFYAERDVVQNERRMRLESSPQGRLQEALMTTAISVHPSRSVIGWMSDLQNLRAKDAVSFFRKYYVPSNMTMVLAGDVDPVQIKKFATTYFSDYPATPPSPRVSTLEPPQSGERRVTLESEAQPTLLIGYKRPASTHADDPALSVLAHALSAGRTGRLYKEMVEDKKIALFAGAGASFPSNKYPGLFLLYSAPAVGKSPEENEKAIYEILDRLKKEKLEPAALNRVKTQVRAQVIRGLDSNMGMAMQLASYHVLFGDWRKLFTRVQDIEKVTAEDVQRVAQTYFTESGRTVVYSKQPKKGESK